MLNILIVVGAILLVLIVAVLLIASRYKIAKPDEAYVVTGRKAKVVTNSDGSTRMDYSGQKVVIGGGVFVIPFIQQAQKISLMTLSIPLEIQEVLSMNNVPLNIDGVAMIKVGGTEDAVRAASQRFLGQQQRIHEFATETLNGSLRAIVGSLTVEQIIRDKAALASRVLDEAENSLVQQGLVIDTLQIKTISDDNNYIRNLARPEAANIEKNAKIAEAQAMQEAAEKESEAKQNIAVANKALALKEAAIKADTDRALAEADAAGPIAKAEQDKSVLASQEQVALKQSELTAAELSSSVNKPAEAQKFKRIQEAEAEKMAVIAASEAELARRKNEAEAIKLEGDAQAEAIRAKGEAEAVALLKKAEAYKEYNNAAVTQMLVDMLPKVASAISSPLSSIKDMTVISNDGASKLTNTTTDILTQTFEIAKKTTGLDFAKILNNTMGGSENIDDTDLHSDKNNENNLDKDSKVITATRVDRDISN